MLEFYIDEGKDERQIIVGGILATTEQWGMFQAEWERVLAIEPALNYWHQSDAAAGVHDFAALTSIQRRERGVLLAGIIREMRPRIVTGSMDTESHDPSRFLIPEKARYARRLMRSPYALLHGYLMQVLELELQALNVQGPIRMVFEASDDRQRDEDMVHSLYDLKSKHIGTRENLISSIVVRQGKNKDARPLEAADLALWCVRRALGQRISNPICDALGSTHCGMVELPDEWVQHFVGLVNEHDDWLDNSP